MHIHERNAMYLKAMLGQYKLKSGIRYLDRLQALPLDFTEASLKRIDALLDEIRAGGLPGFYDFVNDLGCQNFFFGLGIYCAKVIELNSGSICTWCTAKECPEVLFDQSNKNDPRYHLIASFKDGVKGDGYYLPLGAIAHRLFGECPEEKSVWFSAGMYMPLTGDVGARLTVHKAPTKGSDM